MLMLDSCIRCPSAQSTVMKVCIIHVEHGQNVNKITSVLTNILHQKKANCLLLEIRVSSEQKVKRVCISLLLQLKSRSVWWGSYRCAASCCLGRVERQNGGPGPQQGTTQPGALAWDPHAVVHSHRQTHSMFCASKCSRNISPFNAICFQQCTVVHLEACLGFSHMKKTEGGPMWYEVTKTEKPTYCSCPAN